MLFDKIHTFYDLNGNSTQDLNKGITGVTYNLLNLPQSVAIANTLGQATNTYTYAADGRKLRTVQQWSGTNSKQADYVGNVTYESVNGTATTLKRILIDGGYIEAGVYYFLLWVGSVRWINGQRSIMGLF